jgi:hypothetical protein
MPCGLKIGSGSEAPSAWIKAIRNPRKLPITICLTIGCPCTLSLTNVHLSQRRHHRTCRMRPTTYRHNATDRSLRLDRLPPQRIEHGSHRAAWRHRNCCNSTDRSRRFGAADGGLRLSGLNCQNPRSSILPRGFVRATWQSVSQSFFGVPSCWSFAYCAVLTTAPSALRRNRRCR